MSGQEYTTVETKALGKTQERGSPVQMALPLTYSNTLRISEDPRHKLLNYVKTVCNPLNLRPYGNHLLKTKEAEIHELICLSSSSTVALLESKFWELMGLQKDSSAITVSFKARKGGTIQARLEAVELVISFLRDGLSSNKESAV